jgi:mycothiol system anti-sigma-R factor
MSCDDKPDADCMSVVEKAFLYLDGEMQDDDCSEVRRHLDDCSPCLRAYGLEEDFKRLVARKCGGDEAPPELRERLTAKLAQVRIELAQVEFIPE